MPTDGEFTTLVDALEETSYVTLGCSALTVGTYQKPFISLVNETSLGDIKTPRQQRLKERRMRWNLKATYIPGKQLGGTDALSRYAVRKPSDETAYRIFSSSHATTTEEYSLAALVDDLPPVTGSDLRFATDGDKGLATQYSTLLESEGHVDRTRSQNSYTRITEGTSVVHPSLCTSRNNIIEVEIRKEHVLAKHGDRYRQNPQSLHIMQCPVSQSISRAAHNPSTT